MSPDALRAVTRHQADDHGACYGDGNHPRAQRVVRGRDHGGPDAMIEEQVGEEADQLEQRVRDEGAQQTDDDRQPGDGQHAQASGEIAQFRPRNVGMGKRIRLFSCIHGLKPAGGHEDWRLRRALVGTIKSCSDRIREVPPERSSALWMRESRSSSLSPRAVILTST